MRAGRRRAAPTPRRRSRSSPLLQLALSPHPPQIPLLHTMSAVPPSWKDLCVPPAPPALSSRPCRRREMAPRPPACSALSRSTTLTRGPCAQWQVGLGPPQQGLPARRQRPRGQGASPPSSSSSHPPARQPARLSLARLALCGPGHRVDSHLGLSRRPWRRRRVAAEPRSAAEVLLLSANVPGPSNHASSPRILASVGDSDGLFVRIRPARGASSNLPNCRSTLADSPPPPPPPPRLEQTRAPNNVAFKVAGVRDAKSAAIAGDIEAKYVDAKNGVTLTQAWTTSNVLKTQVELENQIAKGASALALVPRRTLRIDRREARRKGALELTLVPLVQASSLTSRATSCPPPRASRPT